MSFITENIFWANLTLEQQRWLTKLLFWIVAALILCVLIFIHELGHFLVAKWCRVGIINFSIGFGPAILSKKVDHTLYKIGCIPLGGYVRMFGEDLNFSLDKGELTEEEQKSVEELTKQIPKEILFDRQLWFVHKPIWQRAAIVAAGPIFNLVSAYIFVVLMLFGWGEEITSSSSTIGSVAVHSPAEVAGIKVGDKVTRIGNSAVTEWEELATLMRGSGGGQVPVTVSRKYQDGVQEEIQLTVEPQRKKLGSEEVFLIGVSPQNWHENISIVHAFSRGGKLFWSLTSETVRGLYGMIMRRISMSELAGPISILGAAANQAQQGFDNVLYFMALVSISLAVLNLLPIPILDGGHLLFFLLEAVRGPVSVRTKELASQVGLAALLLLMGVALTNDIRRVQEPPPPPPQAISWDQSQDVRPEIQSDTGHTKEGTLTPK
jgi:regulator of sigma E protease